MAEEQLRTGGVEFNADRVNVGGDVVGRDKVVVAGDYVGRDQIITNIGTFVARALTAAEEARQVQSIEAEYLAQGVSAFAQHLRDRVSDTSDADKGGPYKGLLEYRLSDAEIFFGRTRAIRELLEHLQRGPLTMLHAESGAGKTSLIQAGISPRLITAGHLPVYLRPYNVAPTLALKHAFLPNLTAAPSLAQASLRDFVSRVAGVLGSSVTLYIFLDQFEEFFIQFDEQSRPDFVRELAECLDDESLNVRWVLALRSEFFGNLATFRPRIRNPFENDYRLNRLTRAEASEAVAEPVARRGITYEDGLIETILDDLGKDKVAPPQVQLVCSTLYESRAPDQGIITRELYTAQGGAAGILRGHLGRVLNRDLLAGQRPIAQRLLEELISSEVRRVIRSHSELTGRMAAQGVRTETLDAVLSQLVDSRLLRVEDAGGEPSYELAHDYLLDEIKLDPAVQARKAAQELLEQEVRAYKRYGTLLSDDKLAIVEARRGELALSDDAKALIQQSERALRRRQRFVFGGIGLVIVLFIVGTLSVLAAVGAQNVADQAKVQQATSEAGAAAASTREAGANAAAVSAATREALANDSAATATAREAIANETLRRAFEKSGIVPVGNNPRALAFDGTRLWVANADSNTVQAIDPATGEVDTPIVVGGGPRALAFDGTRLWVANEYDDTVQAIDPATGEVGAPIEVGRFPAALVFDGQQMWVASYEEGIVQAINPVTGRVDAVILVVSNPFGLAFDGTRLWIANERAGTVQALDPVTGEVGAPIVAGTQPVALAFDGKHLWVADTASGTVLAMDPTTGEVDARVVVGKNPTDLVFDGARLWVANAGDRTVQAIDLFSGALGAPITIDVAPSDLAFDGTRLWVTGSEEDVVQALAIDPVMRAAGATVPVGDSPWALAFDGTRLWVANSNSSTVQSIDPATGDTQAPVAVGYSPFALAIDGTRLWVANEIAGNIQAIDLTTGDVGAPIAVGAFPHALVYDGTQLWVANEGSNRLQTIDPVAGSVVGVPVQVSGAPLALAYDGTRLWVANTEDTVQSVNPTTDVVDAPITVGSQPRALAFDGMRLWVANSGSDTVQAVDITTGDAGAPITVGSQPRALAFDGTRLWVANSGSDTVQAIDPATGKAGTPIAVGGRPVALIFHGARLWVANSGSDTVQYIVVLEGVNE